MWLFSYPFIFLCWTWWVTRFWTFNTYLALCSAFATEVTLDHVCGSYSFCCPDQISDKAHLRQDLFWIIVEGCAYHCGRARQECQAGGHMVTRSGSRERDEWWYTHFLLFSSGSSLWMVPLAYRVGLSTSLTQCEKAPSQVCPQPRLLGNSRSCQVDNMNHQRFIVWRELKTNIP